jgi:hypothetical protein
MEPLGSHWMNFNETLQNGILTTSLLENSSLFKLARTTGISTETYLNLSKLGACFLGCENFQINFLE